MYFPGSEILPGLTGTLDSLQSSCGDYLSIRKKKKMLLCVRSSFSSLSNYRNKVHVVCKREQFTILQKDQEASLLGSVWGLVGLRERERVRPM